MSKLATGMVGLPNLTSSPSGTTLTVPAPMPYSFSPRGASAGFPPGTPTIPSPVSLKGMPSGLDLVMIQAVKKDCTRAIISAESVYRRSWSRGSITWAK